ncbi:MAG: TetR/AcrR family transcriptional regulator [Candidatus Cloacimonetes bacterium]|nr:TetR/AcrR family transcriptional regulator [Candidatus Cloacimonadota bacterium]
MREEIIKQIILAVIECIEEEGIQQVTVRKIADKAKVNPAAINYYFGSKENLIEETLKATLDEAFINNLRVYEILWEKDPLKALKSYLSDTIEGMFMYRGLMKAHFYDAFIHGKYDPEFVRRFSDFLNRFFALISEKLPGSTLPEKKIVLVQVLSAVFYPGLFPKLFEDFLGKDFTKKNTRDKYISILVNNIADLINIDVHKEDK